MEKISDIKFRLSQHEIDYDEAVKLVDEVCVEINKKARELAKKYNCKPRLVNARAILR